MRSTLLVLASTFAAACVYPDHQASKVVELTIPGADLQLLDCWTHNGRITVTGDPAAKDVALKAEMSVRGFSQAEADSNLHLLEVGRQQDGGTLRIWGKYPEGELNNRSPSFRFTMKVPQRLALKLLSHNGDLEATGTEGPATLETHNGDVVGIVRSNQLAVTTHNGDVDLRVSGDGALDGEVRSHNGDVELSLAEGLTTRLEASTHNGRVTPPAKVVDAAIGKRSLKCTIGEAKGRLVVDSHNGDVVIR